MQGPWIDDRRSLGELGESLVVRYLTQEGARVLDRNWTCLEGEIDIVAQDSTGVLMAVEVKTRRSLSFGQPVEAVTPAKVARLRRLLGLWLRDHPDVDAVDIRLDVVGVHVARDGRVCLRHLTGVGA